MVIYSHLFTPKNLNGTLTHPHLVEIPSAKELSVDMCLLDQLPVECDMCLLVDSHLFPSVSSVRMSSGKSVELQVDLEA
jgi:hypothetical protein